MDASSANHQPQSPRLLATLIEAINTRALVFDLLAGWIVWVAILLAGGVHTSAFPCLFTA